MQMFEKKLTNHGHTTKFSVTEGGEGWEVRVEEDSRLVRRAMYTDWHRVERAVSKRTPTARARDDSIRRPAGTHNQFRVVSQCRADPAGFGYSTKR